SGAVADPILQENTSCHTGVLRTELVRNQRVAQLSFADCAIEDRTDQAVLIDVQIGEDFRHFQPGAQTRAVGAPGDLGVGFNAFVGGPGDTRGAQESAATDAVGHGQTIDPALQINAAIGFFRVFLANLDHALLSSISQTKLL